MDNKQITPVTSPRKDFTPNNSTGKENEHKDSPTKSISTTMERETSNNKQITPVNSPIKDLTPSISPEKEKEHKTSPTDSPTMENEIHSKIIPSPLVNITQGM